jgi:protein-S-isoprenylcysteine O-methyltransferase Ste14
VKTQQVKMKMLAKVLNIICNVAFWITAVGFVLFLFASIVISFIPRESMVVSANMSGSLSATLGGNMLFKFDPTTTGNIMIKPFLQALFMYISFGALMVSVILFEVKRILKTVVEDNPFKSGNSKNVTVIALVLMAGSFLVPVFEGRIVTAIIETLKISNINISYSLDGNLLFTGILILILAGVFQYGNYLQEEVDSTL